MGLGFTHVCTVHSNICGDLLTSDGGRRGDIDGKSLKLMDRLSEKPVSQWETQRMRPQEHMTRNGAERKLRLTKGVAHLGRGPVLCAWKLG